ncbi:MAG: hypothetical protein CEE43_06735 [Promethearchaeota archaeon Loki_b32]|nr:MAG: hypothetical protein CEE43_06735 [Candidatus Lokiarchaeota archaeon Loki_b32]
MAVLEIGINLGMKNLVEIKYYSSSDKVLDPNIRAKFLNGLENFINEVYGDEINVISLSSFEIVIYYEMVQLSKNKTNKAKPLLSYAIIERDTNHKFVTKHLQKIISKFLKKFDTNDLISKEPKYFKKFEPKIDKILGDLRFKIEDRIKSIFR